MNNTLLNRGDAIERFAAGVASAFTNRLTSFRSAVATLPHTKTPASQNLLDNARYFSRNVGSVRDTLKRNRASLEIHVVDDGPGIPEHALTRIFERFYTARPDDQGFGQNSGLGLSISKQIVEAHGGKLWA